MGKGQKSPRWLCCPRPKMVRFLGRFFFLSKFVGMLKNDVVKDFFFSFFAPENFRLEFHISSCIHLLHFRFCLQSIFLRRSLRERERDPLAFFFSPSCLFHTVNFLITQTQTRINKICPKNRTNSQRSSFLVACIKICRGKTSLRES